MSSSPVERGIRLMLPELVLMRFVRSLGVWLGQLSCIVSTPNRLFLFSATKLRESIRLGSLGDRSTYLERHFYHILKAFGNLRLLVSRCIPGEGDARQHCSLLWIHLYEVRSKSSPMATKRQLGGYRWRHGALTLAFRALTISLCLAISGSV